MYTSSNGPVPNGSTLANKANGYNKACSIDANAVQSNGVSNGVHRLTSKLSRQEQV